MTGLDRDITMSEQQFSQQEPEEELRKRIIAGSAGSKDYRELGGLLFLSGNSDEAVALYQQAIIMSSTNIQKAAVAVELGLLFYEMSEQAKAQTLAEDALRLLSNESDSHEMLACQGAGQSLLAHCTMVKNAESGKELIRVALETLDRVKGNGPNFEGKTTAYLDAATLHDLLGNVDKATSLCEKFLQCELHEWERISGLIVYGQALRSAGRFGEAEHKIEEALRYASKYKLLLAHLYLELGLDQRGMQCSA